jgi:hypothetical protein
VDKHCHCPEVRTSGGPEVQKRIVGWVALAISLVLGFTLPAMTGETSGPPDLRTSGPVASNPFSVDLTASTNHVNVGESLTVTVTYRWPTGWTVVSPDGEPDPAKDFATAFVTNLPPAQKHRSGQEERRIFTITISATRDGAWALPRPTFTVKTPDGTRSTVAPEVIIQVGAEEKPAELPPPRKAWTRAQGPSSNAIAWWIVAVVGVALAGVIALLLTRRRQQVVMRTPWELFYEDWQAATQAADGKEAGARLSLALRRCLGTVFRFDGPAATTREAALHLRGRLSDDEHRDLVRLLESLDALRWAPEDLPATAVRPLAEQGRAWSGALKRRLDAEAEAARQAAASAKQPEPAREQP